MDAERSQKFANISKYVEGMDPGALNSMLLNASSPNLAIVSFSGKKGSGKDTIAVAVREEMERRNPDLRPVQSFYFAEALKGEATQIIGFIAGPLADGEPVGPLSVLLCYKFNIPVVQATHIVETMEPALRSTDVIPTGWTRSPEVLRVLQFLGTEIRQSQDPIYWVRKTMLEIAKNTAYNQSSFITDNRFAHEDASVRAIGAFNVRIDIDPDVQLDRLSNRDGLTVPSEALRHSSELHLDYSPAFDFRLNNSSDGRLEEKAASIVDAMEAKAR